jgi:hypothetical protein
MDRTPIMQDQTLDTPSKAVTVPHSNHHTVVAMALLLLSISTELLLQDSTAVPNMELLHLSSMEVRVTGRPLLSILHTVSQVMADLLPANSLLLAGDSILAHAMVTKGNTTENKSVL